MGIDQGGFIVQVYELSVSMTYDNNSNDSKLGANTRTMTTIDG